MSRGIPTYTSSSNLTIHILSTIDIKLEVTKRVLSPMQGHFNILARQRRNQTDIAPISSSIKNHLSKIIGAREFHTENQLTPVLPNVPVREDKKHMSF
jgi:hypothetical protein